MPAALLLGLLTGLDNLNVTAALSLTGVDRARKWLLAVSFALFEGLMPLLGLLLGAVLRQHFSMASEVLGPAVLAACGAVILYSARADRETAEILEGRWLWFGLPFSLSLDNLLAGVGLGSMGWSVPAYALLIGSISGAMCLLGVLVGERARRLIGDRAEVLSGVYLLGLAAFSVFFG
ncbi:hypothetical protein C2W62_17980 [Candidatus Entotheonella serta]|nr:hypothetical protein C2W62_17980 [Candidatus Entotheonella serta]